MKVLTFFGRRNPVGLAAEASLVGMQLLTEYFPPGRKPPKPEITPATVFLAKVREPSLTNPLLDPVTVVGFAPPPARARVSAPRPARATPRTIIRRPQSIGEIIQRTSPSPIGRPTSRPLTPNKTVVKKSATIGKLEPLADLGPIPQEALQRKKDCPPPRKRRKCQPGEFKRRCTNWEKVKCQ